MSLVQTTKALADDTRLRILGVLEASPLSVNELLDILGMGQSRVSRHLKILADAGILESRREGTRIFYSIASAKKEWPLLRAVFSELNGNGYEADRQKLSQILQERLEASLHHFETHGIEQDRAQEGIVDAFFYRNVILDLVGEVPGKTIADLGCGTGRLSKQLRSRAGHLIGVDQSSRMLEVAKTHSPTSEFRLGALEHLPLKNEEADIVIASMVLHHMADPETALVEFRRGLKKGGVLILADLEHHDLEIMREKFADHWLGFETDRIETFLRDAGFEIQEKRSGMGKGKLNCIFYKTVYLGGK